LLLASLYSHAQKRHDFSLEKLFAKYPESFDSIIAHKEDYRLQVLYTRIDRDASNIPHLTTYSYDADKYYYYCASMMKLPASALTLEKLNNLTKYRVTMLDSVGIDTIACSDLNPQSMMLGTPYSCLSQYIKEMLLVSNNNAFNPVYDFLGQYEFQERLHQLGYRSAVISNRYAGCDTIQNRYGDPVSLFDRETHRIKYAQPATVNTRRQFYEGDLSPLVGNGYLGGGALINQPKSFLFANYIKLSELHKLLTKIIFPETQLPSEKLNLTHNDYQYLYKCMGMFPRECAYPAFDSIRYPDNYMKYFMGLDSNTYTMPSNIRIFNKVGQAYGFMTDCSYVVDTLNKVEFFLSCAMYLNADGILNDGKYEYDQTGFPFFHNLFNAVYDEELMRHKQFLPKLHLPDFTDTLLVKPVVKPIWLKIDSTQDMSKIEATLVCLADSMWQDRKLYINYDNPTADEIFYRNLMIALRLPSSATYPFDALRQRNISIITSDDKKLRVFSWDKDSPYDNYALMQFMDSNKVQLKRSNDFNEVSTPKLTYKKIYQLKEKSTPIYLLIGETSAASGGSGYLQAFGEKAGQPVRLKIFKENPANDMLYDAILVEKKTGKETITYDSKHKTLSYPVIIKSGRKIKTQTHKLRFDGTIFK
jgi:hypothetical protein